VSSNGKSNGESTGPPINPALEELLRRGRESRKAGEEISRRLKRLVEQLKKKFPDQINTIIFHLDGVEASLLTERNKRDREKKRKERSGEDD
jgi:hypothetical protein